MPDRGSFAIVAIFGFAMIMVLKLYGYSATNVSAFAVVMMLGYGVIAYRIPAVHIRLDRLGDNFYYLGFIYTLASLSAALVQLQRGADTNQIIGSFGIALVSTIVGVAGRVIFAQMRTELDDAEEQVRRDFLEKTEALKGQLMASVNEFETFRTSMRQAADEDMKITVAAAKSQIEQMGNVAKHAAGQISDAFAANRSHAQSVGEDIRHITQATKQLVERLEEADLPTEQINERLEKYTGELEASVLQFKNEVEQTAESLRAARRIQRPWWRRIL